MDFGCAIEAEEYMEEELGEQRREALFSNGRALLDMFNPVGLAGSRDGVSSHYSYALYLKTEYVLD